MADLTKLTERKKIGDFMVEKGLILREWVEDILTHSKTNGLKFGESAVALGYITESDLRKVLLTPYNRQSFFRLNPEYFPQVTRHLLSIEEMVVLGALPLGYKKVFHWFRSVQRLNLGLIDPTREDALAWIREKVPTVKEIKVFQVLPDEYLTTLEQIYGADREKIEQIPKMDESLGLYLQLERRRTARRSSGTTS